MQISFVLTNCSPDNSHGRYVIELTRRLAGRHSVTIYAGAFWPPIRTSARCRRLPMIHRPAVARLATLWAESMVVVRRLAGTIVHVQGADAPIGNVVTAHYCNEAARPFIRAEGGTYSRFNYAVGAAVERYSMSRPRARRIIAVSGMLKAELMKYYGVNEAKVAVLHHGVDIEAFNPDNREVWRQRTRERHGIGNDDFVVLFVGGDYRRKGLIPLLEAVAQLPRNVRVLAVGITRQRALSELLVERSLSSRVILLPPTHDVAHLYALADCFALPTQYDTFSLSTLEALASGLPVVVSRRAGVSEILTHGVDSVLLEDPRDAIELGYALQNILADAAFRQRLEIAARATAERHSWERVAAATVRVYEEVLAG